MAEMPTPERPAESIQRGFSQIPEDSPPIMKKWLAMLHKGMTAEQVHEHAKLDVQHGLHLAGPMATMQPSMPAPQGPVPSYQPPAQPFQPAMQPNPYPVGGPQAQPVPVPGNATQPAPSGQDLGNMAGNVMGGAMSQSIASQGPGYVAPQRPDYQPASQVTVAPRQRSLGDMDFENSFIPPGVAAHMSSAMLGMQKADDNSARTIAMKDAELAQRDRADAERNRVKREGNDETGRWHDYTMRKDDADRALRSAKMYLDDMRSKQAAIARAKQRGDDAEVKILIEEMKDRRAAHSDQFRLAGSMANAFETPGVKEMIDAGDEAFNASTNLINRGKAEADTRHGAGTAPIAAPATGPKLPSAAEVSAKQGGVGSKAKPKSEVEKALEGASAKPVSTNAPIPPRKESKQFKVGDTATKGGKTYRYTEKGTWVPVG